MPAGDGNAPARKGLTSSSKDSVAVALEDLDTACCNCTVTHPIRRVIIKIVDNRWFERTVLLLIVANCVCLAINSPLLPENSTRAITLNALGIMFTALFTVEAILKMVRYGVALSGADSYIRSGWNLLDLSLVILGWVDIIPGATTNFTAFRVLRVLRAFRAVSALPDLQLVVKTILKALAALVDLLLLASFFLIVFAILGVQLFQGALNQRCIVEATGLVDESRESLCMLGAGPGDKWGCPSGQKCGDSGQSLNDGVTGFNNIGQALVTILTIVTLEGWTSVVYATWESVGYLSTAYFVPLVVTVSIFLVELVTGLIYAAFMVVHHEEDQKLQEKKSAGAKKKEKVHKILQQHKMKSVANLKSAKVAPSGSQNIPQLKKPKSNPPPPPPKLPDPNSPVTSDTELSAIALAQLDKNGHAISIPMALSRERTAPKLLRPLELPGKPDAGTANLMLTPPEEPPTHLSSPIRLRRTSSSSKHLSLDKPSLSPHAASRTVFPAKTPQILIPPPNLGSSRKTPPPPPLPPPPPPPSPPPKPSSRQNSLSSKPLSRVSSRQNTPTDNWVMSSPASNTCIQKLYLSKAFSISATVLIMLNSILMASYHFEQPEYWETTLIISEYVFTVIFVAESIIGIAALGKQFFKDGFLVFDLVIVILSVLDVFVLQQVLSTSTGIAALRSLRILRILRLAKSWKTMQVMLGSIASALSKLASLGLVMSVFIFMFALVGHQLFAGKMFSDGAVAADNFDTFGWSLVKVYQIMGTENWDDILSTLVVNNGWGSVVYIIAVMINGKFIFLTVLVAILLASVQETKEQESITDSKITISDSRTKKKEEQQKMPKPSNGGSGAPSWREFKTEGKALCCLSVENPFRVLCSRIAHSAVFFFVIVFFILTSIVNLMIQNDDLYNNGPDSAGQAAYTAVNYITTAVFVIEFFIQICARGFLLNGMHSYLRAPDRMIDFFLVVTAVVDIILLEADVDSNLSFAKGLRAFRILRPLAVLFKSETLRATAKGIVRSLGMVRNSIVLLLGIMFVFAIMGVSLFNGLFYQCYDATGEVLPLDKDDCTGSNDWRNPDFGNFDNFATSWLTLFEMTFSEMWPDVMQRAVDAAGVGLAPEQEAFRTYSIFFCFYNLIGTLIFASLLMSSIVASFLEANSKPTKQIKLFVPRELKPPEQGIRLAIFNLTQSWKFVMMIDISVALNAVIMMTDHYEQSNFWDMFQLWGNNVFAGLFFLEAGLKITGQGTQYFKSKGNCFDFFLVVAWIVQLILYLQGEVLGVGFAVFRLFRLMRLFKLAKNSKRINGLLKTIVRSLPGVASFATIILISLLLFCLAGTATFARIPYGEHITVNANFDTTLLALFTLLRMITGENWNGIMHDCLPKAGCVESDEWPNEVNCGTYAAYVFFPVFVSVSQLILLNLAISTIMSAWENDEESTAAQLRQKGQNAKARG